MPVMNFDLEDGKPPVSFTLKPADVQRFVAFMGECHAANKDAARYRWLRGVGEAHSGDLDVCDDLGLTLESDELDEAIDARMKAA